MCNSKKQNYDAQNQLISVLEGDFRYDFTYDTYGNILSVKYVEDYTDEVLSSNTYTYGNAQWVDQLTKFNGVEFDYDQIGNPLSYYNGSSYTFTWNGRELATATKGSTSVSYKYGADGLRTQKTVGSTVYDYYYIDGVLVRQTWGTNYMDFLYDESGSPYSFIYNGTQYYYVKNLQGDVVKILNASGSVVANYYYDAWGKVTTSSSIGQTNPIRYRGYYYDTDTGFYYLQSRYYDPTIKRFISADDTNYLGISGTILGCNMYSYCENNPIKYHDSEGTFINTITGALIGGIVGGVSAWINGDNVLSGIGIGVGTGVLAGAAADIAIATGGVGAIVIAAIGGALSSATNYAATELVNGRPVDAGKLAVEATVGAAFNVLTFGVGGGSLQKTSGGVMKNLKKGFEKVIMHHTTRKVAGQVIPKSFKGVAKNVTKNSLNEILTAATIWAGSFSIAKTIEYQL